MQGLLALQPRLQLWLGRQGAAAQQLLSDRAASVDTWDDGQTSSAAPLGSKVQGQWDPTPRVGVPVVFPQLPEAIPVSKGMWLFSRGVLCLHAWHVLARSKARVG